MKKLFFALLLCAGLSLSIRAQSTAPLRLQEIDGSPSVLGVSTIKVTNGALSCSGRTCTITISSGGTPGGSNGEFQYNNAGAFGGISTLTTDGSTVTMARNSIGATSTDGIILQNTTAAAAGAQQYSPRLRQKGSGWKTNATAAAQDVEYWWDVRPIQGSANPTSDYVLSVQTNGSGGEPIMVVNDTGTADGAAFYFGRAWGAGSHDIYNSMLVSVNGWEFQFNATSVFGLAQGSRLDVFKPLKIGPGSADSVSLRNATSGGNTLWLTTTSSSSIGGNFVIGGTGTGAGTSATATLAIANGTAPTSSPADTAQLYTADINATAGSAGWHIRNEINTAALIMPGVRYKTDTGDPTDTFEGMMVINTFDNTFRVYAEGAWRTITTW